MSVLDHLPLEVVTEILSYLPSVDLSRVCCVSRRMNAVGKRILYTAPRFSSTRLNTPPSLMILLRSLLSTGGDTLAAHVRSLSVRWDNLEPDTEPTAQCLNDTALVAAAALRAGLSPANQTHSADVVLLLHLLPCLQVLECNAPMDCHAIFTLLQPPHLSQLQHLREFRYNPGATPGSVPMEAFLGLLRLPLLRIVDLRVSYNCDPFPTPAAATSAAGSSAITSLRLRDCSLPRCVLDTILRLPAALTHFSYAPVNRPDPGYATYSAYSVAALRETLQSLHVDLSGGWPGMMLSIIGTPLIENLRDWPALRTLRCPLQAVLGGDPEVRLSDVLPPGLKDLETLDRGYWLSKVNIARVLQLLQDKERYMLALERLTIRVGSAGDTLKVACAAAGVRLVPREEPARRRRKRVKVTSCKRGT